MACASDTDARTRRRRRTTIATEQLEQTGDIERRVSRIEHVLPTLATKEDLKATEESLRSEINGTEQRLRTEITETEKRICTHFDVVTESLRDDIRLVAEAVATLANRRQ